MTENTIELEAKGEFAFNFYIEKAIAEEVDKELIIEGVASTSNIDHDNERMSKEALHAMANVINEKSVPLRIEHSKSENAVFGSVFKAWVDDRNQLHIRARMDKSHPVSIPLHEAMTKEGKKMGFSVGGLVKNARKVFSEAAGKLIKTFYDVELKEVSVTPRPANYDSWAMSKHIAKNEAEVEKSRGTAFYDEFLFANPQLDYLQVFAKSIPDDAWQKVGSGDINKNTIMTEIIKESDKKEETEKGISRSEFATVVKGIGALTKSFGALVAKLSADGPKEQANPEKAKVDEEEQQTAKAEDDETTKAEDKEETTKMDSNAKDQNSPDKAKPEDESPTAKAKTDDYDIETVERSISTLNALTKKLEGMKKADDEDSKDKTEKAEDKDETEKAEDKDETTKAEDDKDETTKAEDDKDETTKGMHPIDKFVLTVTKAIEAMSAKMEKSGKNVPGFTKSMVESIVNDPEAQVEIRKMLKQPGFKKSVAMGVPYMVSKEGKRYALVAQETGESVIAKSKKDTSPKSFKELYKSDFSSFAPTAE